MAPIVVALIPAGASLFSLGTVVALMSSLGKAERGPEGPEVDDKGVGKRMNDLSDIIQAGAMYVVNPTPPAGAVLSALARATRWRCSAPDLRGARLATVLSRLAR